MGLVDPLVDDPDLHALSRGCERRSPKGGGADQLRRSVEVGVIRDARPNAIDSGDVREAGEPIAGDDDGEPVQDDAVVPANVGGRNRGSDSACNGNLVPAQAVEVQAARRRVGEQALWPGEGRVGKRATESRERFGKRRLLQGDDDLDGIRVRGRGEGEGK
jgi:hypothetical protein